MGCVSSRPEVDDGSSESHHASTPSPSGSDSRRHARAAGFETGAVPSEDLSYESYDADSAAVRRSSEGRTIDHSALGSILMDADARTPADRAGVPGALASPPGAAPQRCSRPPARKRDADLSPPERRIRWQRGELVGSGGFGRVYCGLDLDTGSLMAVKQIALAPGTPGRLSRDDSDDVALDSLDEGAEALREIETEVALMRRLKHPNVVGYIGTERAEDGTLHIFMEYVPGGSVHSLLRRFGSFSETVIRVYTRQILAGLEYLHRHQIMHRDIKGANILVDNSGVIKLADFGASKRLAEMVTTEGGHRSIKGTPYWMAPEVIKQTGHGRQADIWSVGCTVLEMATGKPPWSEHGSQVSALFHIASSKSPPPIPEWMSPEGKDFLHLCFNRVPKDRPNATRLLRHPFALVSPSAMPSPSNAVRPSSATSVASLRGDGYPEAPPTRPRRRRFAPTSARTIRAANRPTIPSRPPREHPRASSKTSSASVNAPKTRRKSRIDGRRCTRRTTRRRMTRRGSPSQSQSSPSTKDRPRWCVRNRPRRPRGRARRLTRTRFEGCRPRLPAAAPEGPERGTGMRTGTGTGMTNGGGGRKSCVASSRRNARRCDGGSRSCARRCERVDVGWGGGH